jgi:hypothetical protein
MPELDTEGLVERMLGPAQARVDALASVIQSAGVEAQRAYEDFRGTVSMIPGVGSAAVDAVAKIKADEMLQMPSNIEYRQKLEADAVTTAEVVTDKLTQAALMKLKALESSLAAALVPKPSGDWSERTARRAELQTLLAGDPRDMVTKAVNVLLSGNQSHISELLEPGGVGDIALRGLPVHERKTFNEAATAALMRATGPAELKVVAARAALKTIRDQKIQGEVSAYSQSSHLRLGTVRPSAPDTIVPNVRNTPIPTIAQSKIRHS